jgi:hypothetical protein
LLDLSKVISSLFQTYGYDIESRSTASRYILAKKDNMALSIGYRDFGQEITTKDILNFMATAEGDDPQKSIFISVSGILPEIRKTAEDGGVTLWDKEKLEKEIGRVLLKDVESIGDLGEGHFIRALGVETTPVLSGIRTASSQDLDPEKAEELGLIVHTGELAKKFDTDYLIDEPAGDGTETDLFLTPSLTQDAAKNLAKKTLSNVSINMKLLPYYIYDYSCQIAQESGDFITEIKGKLALNTVMGGIYKWGEEQQIIDKMEGEYSKLMPQIDESVATRKILDAIIEMNTKVVETMEETESVTIIEKKKVRRKEDAIDIERSKVVYLPIWCAEGSNGQMIIDATNGEVMKSS